MKTLRASEPSDGVERQDLREVPIEKAPREGEFIDVAVWCSSCRWRGSMSLWAYRGELRTVTRDRWQRTLRSHCRSYCTMKIESQ